MNNAAYYLATVLTLLDNSQSIRKATRTDRDSSITPLPTPTPTLLQGE